MSKQVTQEGALAETAFANACDVEGFDVLQLERLAIALGIRAAAQVSSVSICKLRLSACPQWFARYADGEPTCDKLDGKIRHSPSGRVLRPWSEHDREAIRHD